jgi:hypothetical protein
MGPEEARTWAVYAGIAIAVVALLLLWVVHRKGRPFTAGEVFRASRWTRGNHLFPTQVAITPTGIVQHTPRWIGKEEESIHMAHVASVKIATGLLFSNVVIETSGGSDPIACHGHRKADAVRMKSLIERYQTEQFKPARG